MFSLIFFNISVYLFQCSQRLCNSGKSLWVYINYSNITQPISARLEPAQQMKSPLRLLTGHWAQIPSLHCDQDSVASRQRGPQGHQASSSADQRILWVARGLKVRVDLVGGKTFVYALTLYCEPHPTIAKLCPLMGSTSQIARCGDSSDSLSPALARSCCRRGVGEPQHGQAPVSPHGVWPPLKGQCIFPNKAWPMRSILRSFCEGLK